MKKISLGLFAVLVIMGNAVYAQKAVMMGRLVDETGKPVPNAEIKITGHRVYYKVKTDNDGLYNTQLIQPASYHVLIDANGKYYTTDKVRIAKPGEVREFYNFTLAGDQANLMIDEGSDPLMVAKLSKIETELNNIDMPPAVSITLADGSKSVRTASEVKAEAVAEKKEDALPPVKSGSNTTSVKIIPGEKGK